VDPTVEGSRDAIKGVIRLREVITTVVMALGTAALQLVMKGLSRTNHAGKNHGLSLDDALFWSDWVIAAALALSGSIVVSSSQGKPIPQLQLFLCFAAIFFGCSVLPFFLRIFAYGPDAEIKSWGWWGLGWVLVANAFGVLVLLSAVWAGVAVYDRQ
jgi:hypothetical protein